MTVLNNVIHAVADSAGELCESVLNLRMTRLTPVEFATPLRPVQCVSVGLVNESVAMQIGLTADGAGRELLTRSLLGFSPEDAVSEQDVADALAEVANILAGGVKTRLNDQYPALKLGLPIWSVLGPGIRQASRVEKAEQPLCVGGNSVVLTVRMESRKGIQQ